MSLIDKTYILIIQVKLGILPVGGVFSDHPHFLRPDLLSVSLPHYKDLSQETAANFLG